MQARIIRGAAITIQAWYRGVLVRRRLAEYIAARQHRLAVTSSGIQSQPFRDSKAAYYTDVVHAAIVIQAAWRGHATRKRLRQRKSVYDDVVAAATTIQAAYRGHCVRTQVCAYLVGCLSCSWGGVARVGGSVCVYAWV